ncbi:MAG: hypothetical protein IJR35_11660 [Synergistaceae bacterium]|nr:hypothetical protein [Synergistaceae bacterium]
MQPPEVIYFELNNWTRGEDYPDEQPFLDWMDNDLKLRFHNRDWIKENKLVVVFSIVDQSANFCITALKDWVEENCPKLLTEYTEFLREPEYGEEVPHGSFDCPFLEWTPENIGWHYWDEAHDMCGD